MQPTNGRPVLPRGIFVEELILRKPFKDRAPEVQIGWKPLTWRHFAFIEEPQYLVLTASEASRYSG